MTSFCNASVLRSLDTCLSSGVGLHHQGHLQLRLDGTTSLLVVASLMKLAYCRISENFSDGGSDHCADRQLQLLVEPDHVASYSRLL